MPANWSAGISFHTAGGFNPAKGSSMFAGVVATARCVSPAHPKAQKATMANANVRFCTR